MLKQGFTLSERVAIFPSNWHFFLSQSLLSTSDRSLTSQLVEGWNYAVRRVFQTLNGDNDGLQLETLGSLKVGLKRWGSETLKTVTGRSSDEKP